VIAVALPAWADPVRLPLEVFLAGPVESCAVILSAPQAAAARSVWLQIDGLQYSGEASIQINDKPWIPLDNETVTVAQPGRTWGGIGGAVRTLTLVMPLEAGGAHAGPFTVRFRFNATNGVASEFRVLAWNLLTADGTAIVPASEFTEDSPSWTAPLPGRDAVQSGYNLWRTAPLVASSLPNSPKIRAHCADCHTHDGRDLQYFGFSNASIVARSRFHGLSRTEGEQIASYIRSLPVGHPGRPWNPPYQPGPELGRRQVSEWAAGAGRSAVLDDDTEALPYLASGKSVGPDLFRPDGDLAAWKIPIALPLPEWNQWLPVVHPTDAWGEGFSRSDFAALYDGPARRSLRSALQPGGSDARNTEALFRNWSRTRRDFLKSVLPAGTQWSPELSAKVYSTQLWQLVKTWEMTQDYLLEGGTAGGNSAGSRMWHNTIAAEAAPSNAGIPDNESGVGGSAVTNAYLSNAWYELQVLLFAGGHGHRNRGPVDWAYLIGRFRDLYLCTHRAEPIRLLIATTKALQSTDPGIGPDDPVRGWRPDESVDPRIMVDTQWRPIFETLPPSVRVSLTEALLTAWMDKNLQYSPAAYLPQGTRRTPGAYKAPAGSAGITGGRVWQAAQAFLEAGVSPELVRRLQLWGRALDDRAARISY
jgi:hypothetical protein